MAKDKYVDLAGKPEVRVRVERVDGIPPRGWTHGPEIWWDRELIAFMTPASPSISTIVEAEHKITDVLKDLAVSGIVGMYAPNARGEVTMFHGTFVKVEVWCPAGTARRLGIKGYGK